MIVASRQREADNHEKYWEGNRNKAIRYWFYNQRGLELFNNFRYVWMTIFGIYFAMKLKNPCWLLAMFGVSLPVLIGIGFVQVHYIGKVMDWLNVRFSTHYTRYTYDLMEEQIELLTQIKDSFATERQMVD